MSLESLYQALILKHYRDPRHRGTLEGPDASVRMRNPTCGDEIGLFLELRDGCIETVRFQGEGCSISQASASMMASLLEGRTLAEASAIAQRFTEMLHGDVRAASDPALGDLRALAGVARYPARVRCALLAWNALAEARRSLEAEEEPR